MRNRKTPGRISYRVKGYDYVSPGSYYLTLCTYDRKCLFGEIRDGTMRLNAYGEIVREEWDRTAEIRPEIELDEFVIMPNHFHGIIHILDAGFNGGATRRVAPPNGPQSGSIGAIIGQIKSIVAKRVNAIRQTPGAPIWQRNYFERVIRDEPALLRIRQYIRDNPMRWHLDSENPFRQS